MIKAPGTKFSEARLKNAQDRVLLGYRERYSLNGREAGILHLFFSPYRVPKGLTWNEVQVVIAIYPLTDKSRRAAVITAEQRLRIKKNKYSRFVKDNTLPEEFTPKGLITRRAFHTGVEKLLSEILTS